MSDPEPLNQYPEVGYPERATPPEARLAPASPVTAEPYPFWTYRDVLILGALALPIMITAFVLVAGLFSSAQWEPPKAVQILPAQFLFYALWFLFLYGWIKTRYGRPFWASMAFTMPPKGLAPSALLGVGTAVVVILLAAVLRPPDVEMPLMELLKDKLSLILVGIFAITLGPLFEELAFRGFLLPLLIRSLTVVPGILITAALFAALHGPEYAWSWRHLLLITLAGAAFGWMRHVSGSTAAATVMHAAYNAVFFLGMLAQRKELVG